LHYAVNLCGLMAYRNDVGLLILLRPNLNLNEVITCERDAMSPITEIESDWRETGITCRA